MSLYVESIPNRNSRPAILLRESRRESGKVKRRTLANLSRLPPYLVEAIRLLLKGGRVVADPREAFVIHRALAHGHVCAVLGLCRQLGLRSILHRRASRERDLALAAIVARVLDPASKLATARQLSPETAASSLGAVLDLGAVSGNEMLAMLDWLLDRQPWIEQSLANRHLRGQTLILYDVSSSYFEGQECPLAKFGHNRDGKKGKKQITFGLLCAGDGCPVAVEVFAGNTSDPATVSAQVARIRERFHIERVALVGDRGMLTSARIREDLEPATLDWISALKSTDIRKLLKQPDEAQPAPLRPGELLPDAVAEIASPDFPGERLMVCLNPRLREERRRKREALLKATEAALEEIARIVGQPRSKLRGRDRINRRVGREANRRKVEKHFQITVTDDKLEWARDEGKITAEALLDGIYIVRTSLPADAISPDEAVLAYKSLSKVERAFRFMKQSRLQVRPIYVYSADHVRAHVFLCMLAYYLEWHLRKRLAPMLFEDDDPEGATAQRKTPVQRAEVSERAKQKAATKITETGLPAHSLRTMLQDLGNLTCNEATLPGQPIHPFTIIAQPTPLQAEAFQRVGVEPRKMIPVPLHP